MDIVIIAEFCGDFSVLNNSRFFYLAKMLSGEHRVELVTSSFIHEAKRQRTGAFPEEVRITGAYEPGYPRNICLKRFYSHYIWGRNILKILKSRKKPDVVYCAVPSLSGPGRIAKYCEKHGIRFIVDVQDLWPEAFQMVVHSPLLRKIIFSPFTALANGVYRRADAVCAVSDSYCSRALSVNRKGAKGTAVFLGTELAVFDRYAAEYRPEKPEGELWLGYAGTLGTSYDLPAVFEAVRRADVPNLKILVMGDGPLAEDFRKKSEGLRAEFTGRLPYGKMCGMLAACDMVVNPIVGDSVATIINKHADYAACGKPVLNTQRSEEYRKLVEEYDMGFNCRSGDAGDLAEKLKLLCADPALRERMGRNARRCAEERFDRPLSYPKLCAVITDGGKA